MTHTSPLEERGRLVVVIPVAVYTRLTEMAAAAERTPSEQAAWLLRRATTRMSGDRLAEPTVRGKEVAIA